MGHVELDAGTLFLFPVDERGTCSPCSFPSQYKSFNVRAKKVGEILVAWSNGPPGQIDQVMVDGMSCTSASWAMCWSTPDHFTRATANHRHTQAKLPVMPGCQIAGGAGS